MKKESQIDILWKNYFKNKNIKNKQKLVEHYYQYVKNISNSVSKKINWIIKPDELYKAIEKFDPNRGVKFDTYAYQKIKGSILDGLRYEDWVPRSVRQRQDNIEGIRAKLENKLGRKPTDQEVFKELGIDELDFHKRPSKYHAMGKSSIEDSINPEIDNNKKEFNNKLTCKNEYNPEHNMLRKEFFNKILSSCTKEEKTIIYLYYYQKLTIKQIAKKTNTSDSNISQKHKNILKKIKYHINNKNNYFSDDLIDIITKYSNKESIFS